MRTGDCSGSWDLNKKNKRSSLFLLGEAESILEDLLREIEIESCDQIECTPMCPRSNSLSLSWSKEVVDMIQFFKSV